MVGASVSTEPRFRWLSRHRARTGAVVLGDATVGHRRRRRAPTAWRSVSTEPRFRWLSRHEADGARVSVGWATRIGGSVDTVRRGGTGWRAWWRRRMIMQVLA